MAPDRSLQGATVQLIGLETRKFPREETLLTDLSILGIRRLELMIKKKLGAQYRQK